MKNCKKGARRENIKQEICLKLEKIIHILQIIFISHFNQRYRPICNKHQECRHAILVIFKNWIKLKSGGKIDRLTNKNLEKVGFFQGEKILIVNLEI